VRIAIASIGWLGTLLWPALYLPHQLGTCTMGSDDAWAASLFVYLPLMLVMLGAASVGIGQRGLIKWFTVPHVFTVMLAIAWVTPYLWGTTILGKHLCTVRDGGFEGYERSAFQTYWAPIQFLALGLLILVIWKTWRAAKTSTA
jgi:hypothetical protein